MNRSLLVSLVFAAACAHPAATPIGNTVASNPTASTTALVVVMNGQEVWIGNDTIEAEDAPSRYLGALAGIKAGWAAANVVGALPPGSVGEIVTYDDHVALASP